MTRHREGALHGLLHHVSGLTLEHLWRAFRINIFSLSLMVLWLPLNVLVLPDRVDATTSSALRGTALGLITFFGVGIAAVVQPLAGRMSDLSHLPDIRRPFIVAGVACDVPCLFLLWWAPDVVWLLVAYVLLQVGSNVAQAAFQALIPDLFKPADRGLASGVKNGLTVVGAAVGLIGVTIIPQGDRKLWVFAFLALGLIAGAVLTVLWVPRVPPLSPVQRQKAAGARQGVGELVQTYVGPLRHSAFGLAVAAQFLFLLGAYAVQRFLRYYLKDRFGLTHISGSFGVALVAVILVGIAAAVLAGHLSDRVGRRPVLEASVIATVVGLVGFAVAPSLTVVAIAGCLMALGVGAFFAVNWALLSDHIPEGRGARFYGVANIATAGASALAGLFGPIVDLTNAVIPAGTYAITFGLAALISLTSLWPLRRMHGGDEPTHKSAAD